MSSDLAVQLLVLLAINLVQLKASRDLQNSKEVVLLKQMQDWGKGVHDAIRKESKDGQYLVAALVSDIQAESPNTFYKSLLKGCPPEPDVENKIMKCRTSAVILNNRSTAIWRASKWSNNKTFRSHPWHGEYRLLHDGIVDRMIQNLRDEKGNDASCRLMLYSFYIPCADIPGAPYSCSQLIADYNNRNDVRCKVDITGYTKVYKKDEQQKTDKKKAVNLLAACRQLKDLNDNIKLVALQEVRSATPTIFQEQFFDCIMSSPLSGCCVDTEDNIQQRTKVVSFFVNTLLSEATGDDIANHYSSSKDKIKENINKKLKENIGIDCTNCSYNAPVAGLYHRYFLGFCAQTALDLSDTFGKPVGGLLSGQWENMQGKYWKSTHNSVNNIFCGHPFGRSLDPSSLCTRYIQPRTSHSLERSNPHNPKILKKGYTRSRFNSVP